MKEINREDPAEFSDEGSQEDSASNNDSNAERDN
jgi:hypothetical protein